MNSKQILKNWCEYFNNGNLAKILDLYDQNSILIPTFSSEIFSEKKQIREYFVYLINEQNGTVQIELNSIFERIVAENMFLLCGNYFFKLKRDKKILARFTFLINSLRANPIIHHHSSVIANIQE